MNESELAQAVRREIAARVRCARCGRHLRARDLDVLGQRGQAWALRARCPLCHAQALLLALVDERMARTLYSDLTPEEWARFKDAPPISLDDVIAFHTFIRAYPGDFSEILDEPLPPE